MCILAGIVLLIWGCVDNYLCDKRVEKMEEESEKDGFLRLH